MPLVAVPDYPAIARLPIDLPPDRAARVPLPVPGHTYGAFDIARRLGQYDHSVAWLCRYLDKLSATRGFPSPLPYLRAGALVDRATPKSRWIRSAVDAWLDGTLPPDLAAARADLDDARAAAVLDARAEGIAA